jgi:adenine deaminase
VIDASGKYVAPGLVETHLHSYHSYLGVSEYVQLLLAHGTTTTADGFYGQGIVAGRRAVEYFKAAFESTPLRLIFLVPVLSWLQNRANGLTPTAGVSAADMFEMLDWDGCRGLEEPPFIPVVKKFSEILDLFDACIARRKTITGHAAGISSRQLQAYVAMGAYTDHESTERADGLEKARAGLKLLMREGSVGLDTSELVTLVTEQRIDSHSLSFCTDVAAPEKIAASGTMDGAVRVAIKNGLPPITAIQLATLNAAEIFGLQDDIGLVAPGRFADMLLLDSLADFRIDSVLSGGEVVARQGVFVGSLPKATERYPRWAYKTVRLSAAIRDEDLAVKTTQRGAAKVRVIGLSEGSIITEERVNLLKVRRGALLADIDQDILPIVAVDRHRKGTGTGRGFVQGFGLKDGALASSVSGIASSLVSVGTNSRDMAAAMNYLAEIGGGQVVVCDAEPVAVMELPILGLQSEDPLDAVMAKVEALLTAVAGLGCRLASPFSSLEFCFAGGVPALKLSDEGLVRVGEGGGERVDLWVE